MAHNPWWLLANENSWIALSKDSVLNNDDYNDDDDDGGDDDDDYYNY